MKKPQYRRPVHNLYALGLTEESANVNTYPPGGEPALVWAADYAPSPVVKALLARGAGVNARDRQGCTPLHYAAHNGRLRNVRLLLAAGADVNAKENDGYTPLMGGRCMIITRLLLHRGADVNARAENGWTALLDAAQLGTPSQVRLLLAWGADIHAAMK